MLTFQKIILTLQNYWDQQGCALLQPYDMEVGAGTFHPATTLRSLGNKSWAAAYVQPSRRPTDGRYGENPNRLQHYYQYQVILKPSPGDIQELYLKSLAAIGIDWDGEVVRQAAPDDCGIELRHSRIEPHRNRAFHCGPLYGGITCRNRWRWSRTAHNHEQQTDEHMNSPHSILLVPGFAGILCDSA